MLGKRILYGGIGIAIVWLAFLVVPIWLRGVDHPLQARDRVDVCAYLTAEVLASLPPSPLAPAPGVPGEEDTGKPACRVEWPAGDDGAARGVWVMVTTERMLTADRRPVRTDRFVETWLAEARASGTEVTPVKGPWRRGALLREPRRPDRLGLLADDAGVVVWINGQGIDEPAFVAFAEALGPRLRAKPPPAGAS